MINTDVTCGHRTQLVLIHVAIMALMVCITLKLKHEKRKLTHCEDVSISQYLEGYSVIAIQVDTLLASVNSS